MSQSKVLSVFVSFVVSIEWLALMSQSKVLSVFVSFVVSIGWLALMSQSHRKLFKSENATNSEKHA